MQRALTGLAHRIVRDKSSKDLAALSVPIKEYPTEPSAYEILDDCGRGVSATVHRALCKVHNDVVAIKRMNLESLNCDLEEIIHEAQTMKNYHNPNVLPLYCSFVSGQELWMVMPFVSGGSVLHIMKYSHPDGLDEVVIATIMRDVLKALEYVHKQGGIHRDIKAGNILLDKDGHVLLGDFGVAASMERSGSWGHDKVQRMTFVGTPCWMAPEVMEQTSGYDSSADIWSFGITLLEMAHGHAPFARFPPMKVLLMTLQNPPPTLDDKGKKHFSKSMREVVTRCLQKDPKMRPTATQLLEHKFFKQARDDEYLGKNLMAGLPSLQDRVQEIRQGRAATNASDNDRNFARSQVQYQAGISGWNFDVAALRAQAALEPDEDLPAIPETDETLEGTLSGMVASQAAAFLALQQPSIGHNGASTSKAASQASTSQNGAGPSHQFQLQPQQQAASTSNGNTSNSAFASFHGQQQLLRDGAMLPPVQPYCGPDGGHVPQSEPVGASGSVPEGGRAPSQQGAESVPLSPGTLSPPGLSREGSVQGPLNALGNTPNASKQQTKKLGRFQIYEPGSEPPPMSPGNQALPAGTMSVPIPMEPSLHTKSTPGIPPHDGPVMARTSEDGIKRAEKSSLDTQESVFDESIAGEPKKKGRFLVVEQQGLSKVASSASLSESQLMASKSRSEVGKDTLGKPPPIPGSQPTTPPSGAGVPVATIIPRLVELLEHSAQQQAAMQKLVGALQDVERGKSSMLLSRTQSTKSLFAEPSLLSAFGRPQQGSGGGDGSEDGMDALRARVSDLEAENTRLRMRNQQLEGWFQQLQRESGSNYNLSTMPSGVPTTADGPAPTGSVGGSSQPGTSPNVSPREQEGR